jgi:hypothetical protein
MEECGICLEDGIIEFEKFNCKHQFCKTCAKLHKQSSIKCPLCRQLIIDRKEAIEECILRTRSLLTMLEKNFQKIASCDADFVDFPDDIRRLWSSNNKMAVNVGLVEMSWENNVNFSNWITNLITTQIEIPL